MSNKIYIDRFNYDYPFKSWGEMFGTKEDFKRYSLQYFNSSKEYTYTGDIFSYNGVEYYLWVASDAEADVCKYILTTKVDFDGETLEDNIQNDVCPYKFVLDEDEEVSYTDDNRGQYILVKQIITEGCCVGENCESLITIDYLNELANDGCVSVTGTPLSGCCEFEGSSDKWSPSAGFFNAGHTNHYPIRKITSDPSGDENGYTFTSNVSASGNCCLNGLSPQQLFFSRIPRKDEVTFGYTTSFSNDLTLLTAPTICDPFYVVCEAKTYTRWTRYCDGESVSPSSVRVSGNCSDVVDLPSGGSGVSCLTPSNLVCLHYGSLVKVTDDISGGNTIRGHVEFTPVTINGKTIANGGTSCSSITTSTTSITLSGYEVYFSYNNVPKIPCGGSGPHLIISNVELGDCGDLSIDGLLVSDDDAEVNGYSVTFPQNSKGSTGGTITINYTLFGETYAISMPYERETCGINGGTTCLEDEMYFYLGTLITCEGLGDDNE